MGDELPHARKVLPMSVSFCYLCLCCTLVSVRDFGSRSSLPGNFRRYAHTMPLPAFLVRALHIPALPRRLQGALRWLLGCVQFWGGYWKRQTQKIFTMCEFRRFTSSPSPGGRRHSKTGAADCRCTTGSGS